MSALLPASATRALLSCALAAGALATRATPPADLEAEVRTFVERYLEALEARDEEAIPSLFIDDGRFAWFTDGARSYSSAAEVVAGLRAFEGVRFETTVSDLEVVPLCEGLVSVRSSFQTRLGLPGPEGYAYGGVITWLLERSPEGAGWRILQGHTSTPGGPPREERRPERGEDGGR